MIKSRSQQMVELLRSLQASSPEIEASAVVSIDGLVMATALPKNIEEEHIAAMSAAMISMGERIAVELKRGLLQQVYIKGSEGYVLAMTVGNEAILAVMARENSKLGLVLMDMNRAVQALYQLI